MMIRNDTGSGLPAIFPKHVLKKHTAPSAETQSHENHTKALLGKGECCIAKKENLPSPN